jgi:hypothetical protein
MLLSQKGAATMDTHGLTTPGHHRALGSVGLLTAGLLAVGCSVPVAADAHLPEPGTPAPVETDPGTQIAQWHQQKRDYAVRHAPELAAARTPADPPADRFTLIATQGGYGVVDTGDAGDSFGDLVAFTDIVSSHGRDVGHSSVSCTRSSVELAESHCVAAVVLDGRGMITLDAVLADVQEGVLHVAVTGGTGEFYDVGGSMTVRPSPENEDKLRLMTFHLTR